VTDRRTTRPGLRRGVRRVGASGAAPDWRQPYIDAGRLLFDWRLGYGEGIVGVNLQQWTDNVSGMVLTAPAVGQRLQPGTLGWQGNPGSARILWNVATPALFQATFATATSVSWVMRCRYPSIPAAPGYYQCGSTAPGTGRYYLQNIDPTAGGFEQYLQKGNYNHPTPSFAAGQSLVRAYSWDNAAAGGGQGYIDGVASAAPIAPNPAASVLPQTVATLCAWSPDGIVIQRPSDLDLAEWLIFADTLSAAEHASISANLFADYP